MKFVDDDDDDDMTDSLQNTTDAFDECCLCGLLCLFTMYMLS